MPCSRQSGHRYPDIMMTDLPSRAGEEFRRNSLAIKNKRYTNQLYRLVNTFVITKHVNSELC